MLLKKAAPLNYSKNAFCLLYSDKHEEGRRHNSYSDVLAT